MRDWVKNYVPGSSKLIFLYGNGGRIAVCCLYVGKTL